MPPCATSNQLTSHCQTTDTSKVCRNPFGFRMAKSLPPEPSRPRPAAKMNIRDMLLGHIALLAMDWLKKYKHLWQNFPANMMAALLTGMAQRAMAIMEKTVELLEGEGHGIGESRAKQQHLKDHPKHLVVNNNERYTDEAIDNCSGHFGKHLSPGFGEAEMAEICFEKKGISERCVMSPSIFLDWRSHWEDSSEEDDVALEDTMSHEELSRRWLGDCSHSQTSLEIGECFGGSLPSVSSSHEKIENPGNDSWQSLESASDTWGRETRQVFSEDLMRHKKHSSGNAFDGLEEEERLIMNWEDEDKAEDALDSETSAVTQGFKSSVVLSLFYSPSEEDGDDLEDWWSGDDEMEESGPSRMSFVGRDSGKETSELKDDALHGDEDSCGLLVMNSDPFHPLCFPKTLQPQSPPTIAQSKPKNQREITVSFYLSKSDAKAEEPFSPPKKLWPKRSRRVTHRSPAHKSYQPDSEEVLISTEASPISQEQNQVIKKVRFSTAVMVHPLVVWDYASRCARHGPWEEMARDRSRFHRRIAEIGAILEPCLKVDHRAKVWRKIHGLPDSF